MTTDRSRRNFTIMGMAALVCVAILLLASPNLIFAPTVTFIDTELYNASGNEIPVRTRSDFGNQQTMEAFPLQIGQWKGISYDATAYVQQLNADALLMRLYLPAASYQPVYLTIVQAKTDSSLHPPEDCFPAQGYTIQSQTEDRVDIQNTSWTAGSSEASIPFNQMIVTKSSADGKISERRVVLYCYVKGNQFYSDSVTLIETDALAPLQGSYDSALNAEKAFISQAMPLMFEPGRGGQWDPLFLSLARKGIGGYAGIAILLLIPAVIISYPRMRR